MSETKHDEARAELLARFRCVTVLPPPGRGAPYAQMITKQDGEWVSYEEHASALADAREAMGRIALLVRKLQKNLLYTAPELQEERWSFVLGEIDEAVARLAAEEPARG